MPHTTKKEPHGYYRKFQGEITPSEILSSNFELHHDPDFMGVKYVINDFTDITGVDMDERHTKIYASTDDFMADVKDSLKIAVVISADPLHRALAENYQQELKSKNFESQVFEQLDAARQWAEQ